MLFPFVFSPHGFFSAASVFSGELLLRSCLANNRVPVGFGCFSSPKVHQLSTIFIPLGSDCCILDTEVIITYIYSPHGTCAQLEVLQHKHGRQPWRSVDVLRITGLSPVNGSQVFTNAATSVSRELSLFTAVWQNHESTLRFMRTQISPRCHQIYV